MGDDDFVKPVDQRDWAYYRHDVALNDAGHVADPQERQELRRLADRLLAAELRALLAGNPRYWNDSKIIALEIIAFGIKYSPNNNPGTYHGPRFPAQSVDQSDSDAANAIDPNEKASPAGYGDAHFLASGDLLSYRVEFENLESATAPAQLVEVTDQLDPNLD